MKVNWGNEVFICNFIQKHIFYNACLDPALVFTLGIQKNDPNKYKSNQIEIEKLATPSEGIIFQMKRGS